MSSDLVQASHPRPRLALLAVFTLAYIAASVYTSIRHGNREFVFYIVVMAVLIAVIALVHRRVGLTGPLLWALSLWGMLHMAGGLVPIPKMFADGDGQSVLYSLWLIPQRLKYDQVVHAYGFGVTTWLCWHVLRQTLHEPQGGAPKPTFGLLVLCGAAGMGFGALNEVIEFIAVLTIPNTNVGGYENTGWDLVANLAGAALAAVMIRLTASARP